MANSYTFTIEKLEVKPQFLEKENVVFKVIFRFEGTDEDGNKAYTQLGFRLNNPAENFVPFEDLTEETVMSWIAPLYDNFQEKLKEQVDRKLQSDEKNLITLQAPWES